MTPKNKIRSLAFVGLLGLVACTKAQTAADVNLGGCILDSIAASETRGATPEAAVFAATASCLTDVETVVQTLEKAKKTSAYAQSMVDLYRHPKK